MKNELKIINHELVHTEDKIYIKDFDILKKKVSDIAQKIDETKVNEESIKDVKKMLASANKDIKVTTDLKNQLKTTILKPFVYLEDQVKELVKIIQKSESIARQKVRELEEKEMENKKNKLIQLFDKKNSKIYKIPWLEAENFLKREHLNKSYSMNKIEADMVTFLEKVKMELKIINDMENIYEDACLDYQKNINLMEVLQKNDSFKKCSDKIELPCKVFLTIEDQMMLKNICDLLERENIKYIILK